MPTDAEWRALAVRWRVRSASGELVELQPGLGRCQAPQAPFDIPDDQLTEMWAPEAELESVPEGGDSGADGIEAGSAATGNKGAASATGLAQRLVQFEERDAYIEAAVALRLHEFDGVVAELRRGMGSVCATQLLPLFTWRELEARVCGAPRIDVSTLRSITKYDGQYHRDGANHPVIERFWRTMDELSEVEKSAVVAFSWGRSRLPAQASLGGVTFNIDDMDGGDDFVPTSSTCDFRLHLPMYSTQAALKAKLLYAISIPSARKEVRGCCPLRGAPPPFAQSTPFAADHDSSLAHGSLGASAVLAADCS
eukprot:SAG11_NODE_104_length_16539_cov_8.526642_14_plen_310_part_00